jgi:hypothetical protein
VNIDALIERDRSVGSLGASYFYSAECVEGECSPQFAPRFVGCDHAYTMGKMTH